jgi:hypothetical protein
MRWIEGRRVSGLFWIRVFGRGFHVKDVRRHPLLFSERNGYCRRVQVGNWSIKALKKKR